MSLAGVPAAGPFRGAIPFDESASSVFFGRTAEVEEIYTQITFEGVRVTALTGPSGVGKTSLLRAGLLPILASQGLRGLYIGSYDDLEQELLAAAGRIRAEPPATGEAPPDYVARLTRSSPAGTILLLDHLETIVGPEAPAGPREALVRFLSEVLAAGGQRLRLLFSIEARAYHLLGKLLPRSVLAATGSTFELHPFSADQAAAVIEQTALQTGAFIEAGLAGLMANDLCRRGPCLPLDLQLVSRTVMDLRLTSVRRYERSGGADLLRSTFFERMIAEAGGTRGRKVLLDLLDAGLSTTEQVVERTRLLRPQVEHALSAFLARGVIGKKELARGEAYDLLHPGLGERAAEYAAVDRARARSTRHLLRRRVLAGERLTFGELVSVRQNLGGALSSEEQLVVRRSVRRKVFNASLGTMIVLAILTVVFIDLGASYTLGYEPEDDPAGARVVVRMGRPDRPLLTMLPHDPPFGSVLADTGFAAAGLADDLAARVNDGHAMGKIERGRAPAVPGWLQAILAGLRPVQRGTATVLLGEPSGILALKQAFTDPAARRQTLDVLEVVGQGVAGEDEILANALTDASVDVRRRAVEVAAAIDKRVGKPAHAATLRAALSDESATVRGVVLTASASLGPQEASDVLRVALSHPDPALRRQAETSIEALATTAPEMAAAATKESAASDDPALRRTALALLTRIAATSPDAARSVAIELASAATISEETRIEALLLLRRMGRPADDLRAVVTASVGPSASPRLRAAALPLHAQLLDPVAAEELARTESRGAPLARSATAAIWGILAETIPESAAKALRAALLDPAAEVRAEAARALGKLRRDGLTLLPRALLDPAPEVGAAALEAAAELAGHNAFAAADALAKAQRNVRVAMRPDIVTALGKVARAAKETKAGDKKASVVLPGLVLAFKEGNVATRERVANVLCELVAHDPQAVSPYLRLAARDADRDVRSAAASCLEVLAVADPKGATRLATELAQATEASVRAAAAESLGRLVEKGKDAALPPVLILLADADRGTRVAALEAFRRYGEADLGLEKGGEEAERLLAAAYAKADRDERLVIVRAAAENDLIALVREAAADPDESLRLEAIRGAATCNPPALDLLRAAADAPSGAARALAIKLMVGVRGVATTEVLPIFESMLRTGDPETRENVARSLGDLSGGEAQATEILRDLLGQRSERVRRSAAEALGAIASRAPTDVIPLLERALADPSHDVRVAASRGLAIAWATGRGPDDLAAILVHSEADSRRRFVALEALIRKSRHPGARDAVAAALGKVVESGPPLGRLAAAVGLAFLDAAPKELHGFLDRLLGG
jgi:HEAT repeat protein